MRRVAGREVSRAVQGAASEVSGEGERGVWARQRGRGGGQDQTFPVACPATAVLASQGQILQPPAPDYPRVIHGVTRCGGGFPSLKLYLDPLSPPSLLRCFSTRQGCGIHWFTPEPQSSSSSVLAHSEPKRRTQCHVEEAQENTRMSSCPIPSGSPPNNVSGKTHTKKAVCLSPHF